MRCCFSHKGWYEPTVRPEKPVKLFLCCHFSYIWSSRLILCRYCFFPDRFVLSIGRLLWFGHILLLLLLLLLYLLAILLLIPFWLALSVLWLSASTPFSLILLLILNLSSSSTASSLRVLLLSNTSMIRLVTAAASTSWVFARWHLNQIYNYKFNAVKKLLYISLYTSFTLK